MLGVLWHFGNSEKGQSLISAYQSLAITASTSTFEKLSTHGYALQEKRNLHEGQSN
jgi:hypothetical protein